MRWRVWRRRDRELDDEITGHLEMAVRDRMARGESRDQALAEARREFGNVGLVKEVTREVWGGRSIERLTQDLRYGVRLLLRSPGLAIVALTCIALGVGVTSTIFAAVNGLLLRPLPYPEGDRLAVIHTRNLRSDRPDSGAVSWADFVVWKAANRTFADMGVWSVRPAETLGAGGEPALIGVAQISPGVTSAMGLLPIVGRAFDERDQQFGNHFVALLTHEFWTRRYGGRQDTVGDVIPLVLRPVPLKPYVIVGVLPAGVTFPEGVDVFVPLQVDADEVDQHAQRQARGAIGRFRPGVTMAEARADIVTISRRLQTAYPKENANREADVTTLRDELVGERRMPVLLLQGAAMLVLIIACANIANLTLARAGTRRRELAVRSAVGASRVRIVRQLLTESVLLALVGGAVGVLLALLGVRLLVLLIPGGLPTYTDFSVDGVVLAFTIAVSTLTGVVFGITPALRGARTGAAALREGGGHTATSAISGRLRHVLVAAEVALSFVLTIGAALVVRSNLSLQGELGFDKRVLWVSIPTPPQRYEGAPREAFFNDLTARVRSMPGVVSVGRAAAGPPLGPAASQPVPIDIEGRATPSDTRREAIVSAVDPSYLGTIGIPILRGRGFTEEDRPHDARAQHFSAIVNQAFVKSYLPGLNPIGHQIRAQVPGASSLGTSTFTVVGVSRDYRQERPPSPIAPRMYVCVPLGITNTPLVIRMSGDPRVIVKDIHAIVRQMDPALRVAVTQTFEDSVSRGLAQELLYERVLGIFAMLAVGMAVIGMYGVISYTVTQRMHEFGVRIVLGATPRELLRLVIGQGLRPAIAGLGLGVLGALGLTRLLAAILYGVRPNDPATFISVAVGFAAISLVAGLLPARRAARVNPIVTLRAE